MPSPENAAAPARQQPTVDQVRTVGQPDDVMGRRNAEHWVSTLYMRRLSPYASWLAIRLGLSANTVTVIMIIVGVASAAIVAIPGVWSAAVGALGIQLYLLLDCSDGEVARWYGTTSAAGVYLDRLGHYLVEATLFVALGWRAAGSEINGWLVAGLALALLAVLAKVETDLVQAARATSGLQPLVDETPEWSDGVGGLRRIADAVPLHRALGAVEASLLILLAAVIDTVVDDMLATRVLLIALLLISAAVVVLHLVSILASNRLATD